MERHRRKSKGQQGPWKIWKKHHIVAPSDPKPAGIWTKAKKTKTMIITAGTCSASTLWNSFVENYVCNNRLHTGTQTKSEGVSRTVSWRREGCGTSAEVNNEAVSRRHQREKQKDEKRVSLASWVRYENDQSNKRRCRSEMKVPRTLVDGEWRKEGVKQSNLFPKMMSKLKLRWCKRDPCRHCKNGFVEVLRLFRRSTHAHTLELKL